MERDERVRMFISHVEEDQEPCKEIKIEEEVEEADVLHEEMYAEQNTYMRATDEEGMMVQNDSWQNRCNQMEGKEKATMLQNGRDAKHSVYNLMTCEEKELALEMERKISESEQSRFCNSVHVTSDLICEENTQTATIWGQSGEKSTFLCNTAVSCELDKSFSIEPVHVVCDYCQAKKWKGEQCRMCCSNRKVQLQPVEGSSEVLTTFPSGTDHLLQHIEMYSCDLQMASLGASAKVSKVKLSM
jgi:hypothetical protein